MRRARRATTWVLLILALLAGSTAWWARRELRASLPTLDGEKGLAGLSGPVSVARDELGIPTISGGTRSDVALATGYLHAQDRFFQMDLSRRRAAGELAALVGPQALPADRQVRIHRFREQAQRAVALLGPGDRTVLDAYVRGVNAGINDLSAPPFEYLLLRQEPAAWRAEDSLLVVLSMFVTLQDDDGAFESTLGTMYDVLPGEVADFLVPAGTEWDTPVVGGPLAGPPVPGPDIYDLRRRRAGRETARPRAQAQSTTWLDAGQDEAAIGSNNWAVGPGLSTDGGAIVANDMHLGIRVPSTWYRAVLEWPDAGAQRTLAGVTLPGVPALVAGSNGDIAWGFTNSYADTSDIVLLETDPARPDEYFTPEGWRRFEVFSESIEVAGAPSDTLLVRWTIWGPVLPPDFRGRQRAYRWVAHSAERLAADLTPLERASTVEAAFDAANGIGTPAQNMVVADRDGHIGWSIYGTLPRREGMDGRLPQRWSTPDQGWAGWLDPVEYPRLFDPPEARIWTANARVAGGSMLARLGDGNWEVGSRARIIRERLFARARFTPADMLAIQLDTRAEFLERWRQLVLTALSPAALSDRPARQAFRDVVEHGWSGEASPDSAAYRLTRMFRDEASERVFTFLLAECYEADPAFDYGIVRRREGPLWTLVTTQPAHLLDPAFNTWDDLLVSAVDEVIASLEDDQAGDLRSRVWSQMNTPVYRHPLSAAVPLLGRWLDMPVRALPGDLYTPRVQWRANGASERMVVSPGRERDGIMHMPTGQSGHPLSPFYANSHDAWVEGRPTPFLPGPAMHMLTLTPAPR